MTYADTVTSFRPITELFPADWQSNTIQLPDGGMLHYWRTGTSKPPMVLLHGLQVDGRMWLRTALTLQSDYDLILPDVRGHGLSSPMPDDLTAETLSDDLVTLLESLHLMEKPILAGHSMGADIALRLANKMDAKQVILVDPALKNIMKSLPPIGDTLPEYMQPIVQTMQSLSSLPHLERMKAGLMLLPPGVQGWHENDYVSFVEGQSRFDANSYKRLMAMGYVIDSPDVIASVPCPITLLTAKQMMMRPEEFKDAVAIFTDNWQTGQHIHFEDSGHFIPFEQFEKFIATIKAEICA